MALLNTPRVNSKYGLIATYCARLGNKRTDLFQSIHFFLTRAATIWLLRRIRASIGPSRNRHVFELLSNGVDAQAGSFF